MSHYIIISFLKKSVPLYRRTRANILFEEKSFKVIHSLFRHSQQCQHFEFCTKDILKHSQPTNGTVLSVPPLATFALPILAGAVLSAAGVAGPLVAGCACPAVLAATSPSHAHAVCAAVHRADLYIWEGNRGEKRGRECTWEWEGTHQLAARHFNSRCEG